MIGLKIIMFILKHRQVLEKVWARPTIFLFCMAKFHIAFIIMKNYLRLLSTFKKHLTILCMTFCGLNLWRLASVEKC